jgi:uncharacterized protein (TIGR03435 family)
MKFRRAAASVKILVACLFIAVATIMPGQTASQSIKPKSQSPEEATKLPAFEVVTIKPIGPNSDLGGFLSYPGGRVMVGYATVDMLMSCAFNIQELQIAGGPDWVGKDRYDVEALPPDLSPSRKLTGFIANPTDEQQKMLLSLLVDRFGLKFHRENREGPVFILTRGSAKLLMQPPKDPNADPSGGVIYKKGGIFDGEASGTNISMPLLAGQLSVFLKRPVLDRTGLQGSYDFYVEAYDPTNTDYTSAAIESLKRIGLRLKGGKGPIETIVIDSVTRPTQD